MASCNDAGSVIAGRSIGSCAEKMSALMTVDYLQVLAQQGDRAAFDRVLAKVPSGPPDIWDRWDAG
jgi:hypothetical protein